MFSFKNRGFTLIELLVVIAIIGLLASVVLASLEAAREKARDARRLSDAKQVELALELYYHENGYYPSAVSGNPLPTALAPSYMPSIPVDPVNTGSMTYGYTAGAPSSGQMQAYIVRIYSEAESKYCIIRNGPSFSTSFNPTASNNTVLCSEL